MDAKEISMFRFLDGTDKKLLFQFIKEHIAGSMKIVKRC